MNDKKSEEFNDLLMKKREEARYELCRSTMELWKTLKDKKKIVKRYCFWVPDSKVFRDYCKAEEELFGARRVYITTLFEKNHCKSFFDEGLLK